MKVTAVALLVVALSCAHATAVPMGNSAGGGSSGSGGSGMSGARWLSADRQYMHAPPSEGGMADISELSEAEDIASRGLDKGKGRATAAAAAVAAVSGMSTAEGWMN